MLFFGGSRLRTASRKTPARTPASMWSLPLLHGKAIFQVISRLLDISAFLMAFLQHFYSISGYLSDILLHSYEKPWPFWILRGFSTWLCYKSLEATRFQVPSGGAGIWWFMEVDPHRDIQHAGTIWATSGLGGILECPVENGYSTSCLTISHSEISEISEIKFI